MERVVIQLLHKENWGTLMDIQRFRAELTTGFCRCNPENLVRDEKGEWVAYKDAQQLLIECMEWNWGEEAREHIPTHVREKFERLTTVL